MGTLLSGCIVLPYPHTITHARHDDASRENLGEKVPEFIVAGQTTRQAVLLHLGAPDGAARDESWFAYGSAWREEGSGLGLAYAGHVGYGAGQLDREKVQYRRLLVRFDTAGVVTAVEMQEKECLRWYGAPGTSIEDLYSACLEMSGADASSQASAQPTTLEEAVAKQQQLIGASESVQAVYADALWFPDVDLTVRSTWRPFPGLQYGTIILSDRSLVFKRGGFRPDASTSRQARDWRRIPYSDIASINVRKGLGTSGFVAVIQTNGHVDSFSAVSHFQAAADLLQANVRAVRH